jgi:SP family general alpha glucoside:H+ symporter-like MFS transporter
MVIKRLTLHSFDPQLLGQLYATPAFQRDFGYQFNGEWIISAPWQTGLSMGSPIGQVVGAFCASYPMEWFGRKKTFGACVIISSGFTFIQFFARSLPTLLAGELLGGLVSLLPTQMEIEHGLTGGRYLELTSSLRRLTLLKSAL